MPDRLVVFRAGQYARLRPLHPLQKYYRTSTLGLGARVETHLTAPHHRATIAVPRAAPDTSRIRGGWWGDGWTR